MWQIAKKAVYESCLPSLLLLTGAIQNIIKSCCCLASTFLVEHFFDIFKRFLIKVSQSSTFKESSLSLSKKTCKLIKYLQVSSLHCTKLC